MSLLSTHSAIDNYLSLDDFIHSLTVEECFLWSFVFYFTGHLNFSDYPAHSGDSFCSSDISLDGSNFDQLDEGASDTMSLQNLEVHHHSHQLAAHSAHEPLNLGTGAVVNPIDKLYLMQNSYFSTDHWSTMKRGCARRAKLGRARHPAAMDLCIRSTSTSATHTTTYTAINEHLNPADDAALNLRKFYEECPEF